MAHDGAGSKTSGPTRVNPLVAWSKDCPSYFVIPDFPGFQRDSGRCPNQSFSTIPPLRPAARLSRTAPEYFKIAIDHRLGKRPEESNRIPQLGKNVASII